MVMLTRTDRKDTRQALHASPGNGRRLRTGSGEPGSGPRALSEVTTPATEASLTEARERRLSEARLRNGE
jgi:hypothetical protein